MAWITGIHSTIFFSRNTKAGISANNHYCPQYHLISVSMFQEALVLVRFPVAQAAQCKADCSATVGNFGGKFIGAGGQVSLRSGIHDCITDSMLSL